MWLLLNKTLDNEKELLAAGKALCMCQKFESTCKDIVMWLCSSKSLIENKIDILSVEHSRYVDELLALLLGKSINRLASVFKYEIPLNEIEELKAAKDSRNYVCHELLRGLISDSFSGLDKSLDRKAMLQNHIQNVASGDYLVSKWSYEFHEKESGMFYDKEKYVEKIVEWIVQG